MKLDIDGVIRIEEAEGNGPVDAVFNCIKALVPHEAKLELYQVHAVTEGTEGRQWNNARRMTRRERKRKQRHCNCMTTHALPARQTAEQHVSYP